MAVLSSRAQERRSREKNKNCPRPPLLLGAPNQNRHATQATSGPSQVSALMTEGVHLMEVVKIAQCLLTINIQRLVLCRGTVIKFHSKEAKEAVLYFLQDF